ncbi:MULTISPECIES: GNAT family N-acetyltransferase [Agrobacterium]|jgi:phosphinothricin acetyltransferase|uniref:Phosphinothricin acetyltransferase n=3 Tax=Agrobacterium tumefaciens TaxID=358 RepID=A0AAW8LST4_AGRTU|nr:MULTISPECIES: GNAT family N-acetyltransferase [Agrobacterium]AYM04782.1 phosphinothricin acetyltransferase [Agrobacterium tumefaciens]AYM80452.1 phosphinothricin acetyltransferase [Agrobacterium tumefaciens]EHH03167.1 phosphinothricin acetyltransferase [Agrobacterium tumefaciens CCNWGS0286]KWT86202.1 acetyltransferase [Agrobacterium tumefaciens str. B6]MBP2507268.1 phosphinothricin acetyltransferase [Agrobacterium tumefaciens]
MTVELRDATVDDLSGIMEIYNDAVLNTTAIWNDVLVDLENRKEWFAARKSRGFPVIVAILDGKVAGYASYGDWRAFDGYRHTREHSVYVQKDARGHGIGKKLMQALIDHAAGNDVHVLIAAIEAENIASIRLHESLGFRVVGRFSEVGIKFGRWLDLTCMELKLG